MKHMMRNIFIILVAAISLLLASPCHASGTVRIYCRVSMIYVNDTLIYSGSGDAPRSIELPSGSNKLKIAVMGIADGDTDSLQSTSVEYASKLASRDNEWSQWSTQREFIYYKLPGGLYTFQAKARIDGVCITESPTNIAISVAHPFWTSIMGMSIILSVLILACGLIALIVWKRGKKELQKSQHSLQKCMESLKEATSKLSNQQESHNKNIQVLSLLSKAGQNIIKNFSLKEIYNTTYKEINKFFETDNIGIGTYNGPHNSIDFCSFIMNGESMPFARYSLDYENNMEVFCYLNNKTIVMDDYVAQLPKYINTQKFKVESIKTGSAVYMPLFDNEMTIGVLTIHNKAKNYFNSYHLGIIHNIASYLETAIVNYHTDRKAKRRQKLLEEKTINLEKTNNELQRQRNEIETKNRDLTRSIEYASTIQTALMPGRSELTKMFPKSFLMILPKDIVSGDFFWLGEKFGRKYMAHCDCAGHGVPGAFLSMMGKVFLDEILQNLRLEDTPGDIIRRLNDKIYDSICGLQNKVGGIDGMDVALCMINSRNTVLQYAGAYRPLYMVRDGEVSIINCDKRSVGNTPPDDDFQWGDNQIMIHEGDFILMCSDGYADQFGQESGKKMGRRNFCNLILEASRLENSEDIEKFFLDSIIKWRGNQEQIDDVSLSGFKITASDDTTIEYDDDEEDEE